MHRVIAAPPMALVASVGSAQGFITATADDGFRLVRFIEMVWRRELRGNLHFHRHRVPFGADAAGKPLAVAPAFPGNGVVLFQALPATIIDSVVGIQAGHS